MSSVRVHGSVGVVAAVLAMIAIGLGGPASADAQGQPKRGGTLKVGLEQEVSNLDPATSTQGSAINMMQHVYSTVFRADDGLDPVPDLVERLSASTATSYVFHLRKGSSSTTAAS